MGLLNPSRAISVTSVLFDSFDWFTLPGVLVCHPASLAGPEVKRGGTFIWFKLQNSDYAD